jgi:hypothetical protein
MERALQGGTACATVLFPNHAALWPLAAHEEAKLIEYSIGAVSELYLVFV